MALFAPVAPGNIVIEMRSPGNYHLLLAHDVVKYPDHYQWMANKAWTKIMDNSVVETGGAVDFKMVAEAQRITRANVVVMPDVYVDGPATLAAVEEAYPEWDVYFRSNDIELMVVPQGRNYGEWIQCAEALSHSKYSNIRWWGIPRNIIDKNLFPTRMQALHIAHMLSPRRKIHLLGFSDNILDDMLSARFKCVTGIDSTVPLRAASLNIPMSLKMKMPPRGDWWETVTYLDQMDSNCELIRKWCVNHD